MRKKNRIKQAVMEEMLDDHDEKLDLLVKAHVELLNRVNDLESTNRYEEFFEDYRSMANLMADDITSRVKFLEEMCNQLDIDLEVVERIGYIQIKESGSGMPSADFAKNKRRAEKARRAGMA